MPERITFENGGLIDINGELYEVGGRHTKDGARVCKKVDKKEIEQLIEKLSKKLVKFVDKEEIIRQALKEVPMKTLKRIDKNLREKKPAKKRPGCIMLKIGNDAVFIR